MLTQVSVSAMDAYSLLVEPPHNSMNMTQSYLAETFNWLNILIRIFPMWSTKSIHTTHLTLQTRNQCLSIIMITITTAAILYHLTFVLVFYIMRGDNVIYQIIYTMGEVVVVISRLLNLFYFVRHFDFPWNSDKIQTFHPKQMQIIAKYKRIIFIFLFLIIVLDIIMSVHFISGYLRNDLMNDIIMDVIGRIFQFFPCFITMAVAAVIFLQYHLHLLQFIDALKADSVNFKDLLKRYVKTKKLFEKHYNVYLDWSIKFYLLSILLDVWMSSFAIESTGDLMNIMEFFEDTCIASFFVVTASIIGESFNEFESKLYEYGVHGVVHEELNFLMSYVTRYPFTICIGNVQITRKKAARFVLFFTAARIFAYSARYIVL